MEYYSAYHKKNELMPFTATWMDPEITLQGEVREGQISFDNHLYVESEKTVQMNLCIKQT